MKFGDFKISILENIVSLSDFVIHCFYASILMKNLFVQTKSFDNVVKKNHKLTLLFFL